MPVYQHYKSRLTQNNHLLMFYQSLKQTNKILILKISKRKEIHQCLQI
ncbi:unnamed protein product [Schistosoma curassoni]|uniref:Uncharacterized protein n=1 Tax=Schistosoma curassoni TaxID=6186 RepID=A0A183KZ76_9TREM|nr:unnamed protein product [Schistosoma curassoni]